jgi:hypothetical protein
MDVIGQTRHQIAGFSVLEVTEWQLLQVGKHPIAQIGFAAARETMNMDAPAIAEEALQCRAEQNQRGIFDQRALAIRAAQRRVDTALNQPRQRDTGQVGGDEREDAENEKAAVAINQKLDAMVIAKNRSALFFTPVNSPSAVVIL